MPQMDGATCRLWLRLGKISMPSRGCRMRRSLVVHLTLNDRLPKCEDLQTIVALPRNLVCFGALLWMANTGLALGNIDIFILSSFCCCTRYISMLTVL